MNEDQAIDYNLALPAGQLRFAEDLRQFSEYFTRADECQRLADRYPTAKQQYEGLAQEWRDLAKQHCRI